MPEICLSVRFKEHRLSSGAVGQHFSECEHAQFLAILQDQFTLLNDLPLPSDNSSPTQQNPDSYFKKLISYFKFIIT